MDNEPRSKIDHYLIKALWAIQWKKGYRSHAYVLLSIWTLACFHTLFILYTTPIWLFILYRFIQHDNNKQDINTSSIRKEIDILLSPFHWFTRLSISQFTLLCLFWMLIVYLVDLQHIIWLMGLSFLISNHTLVHIIRNAYHVSHSSPQSMKSVPILHPTRHLDRMYRFVIIEHQRSWLGNWTTLLLPNERPEWSDEYLQKTPSIHSFKLPPPVIKKGTRFAWHWASQDWEIDLNRNVDKEGWEYGSWDWKSWASKSSLSLFTRRRYWIRYARLEQLIVHDARPISIQSTTSHTMDDTLSCSSSVTSFDSLPSTPPNTITYLHKKKSSSTSAASVNSYSPVEPYFSNDHIWLHR